MGIYVYRLYTKKGQGHSREVTVHADEISQKIKDYLLELFLDYPFEHNVPKHGTKLLDLVVDKTVEEVLKEVREQMPKDKSE